MKVSQAIDIHLQYHKGNSKKNSVKTCESFLSCFNTQLFVSFRSKSTFFSSFPMTPKASFSNRTV